MNICKRKIGKDYYLVIEIPYKEDVLEYGGDKVIGQTNNIIGLIVPQEYGYECGFAQQIDMSYKGKPNQWTDIIINYDGSKKEFKNLCKKLDIETYEYPKCAKCKKAIYGTFTLNNKGDYVHIGCNK